MTALHPSPSTTKKKKKKYKRRKNCDLPKKPKTPYTYFQLAVMDNLWKEVARTSGTDSREVQSRKVARISGQLWRLLDEERRKPFKDMAIDDNERYQDECITYESKHGCSPPTTLSYNTNANKLKNASRPPTTPQPPAALFAHTPLTTPSVSMGGPVLGGVDDPHRATKRQKVDLLKPLHPTAYLSGLQAQTHMRFDMYPPPLAMNPPFYSCPYNVHLDLAGQAAASRLTSFPSMLRKQAQEQAEDEDDEGGDEDHELDDDVTYADCRTPRGFLAGQTITQTQATRCGLSGNRDVQACLILQRLAQT